MLKMRKKKNDKFYLLLGALVLVLALTACGGGGGNNPKPAEKTVITGKILKEDGKTAIQGAKVVLGTTTVTTLADGVYTLSNVKAGDNTLTVTATNYYKQSKTVTAVDGKTVTSDIQLESAVEQGTKTDTYSVNCTITFAD